MSILIEIASVEIFSLFYTDQTSYVGHCKSDHLIFTYIYYDSIMANRLDDIFMKNIACQL